MKAARMPLDKPEKPPGPTPRTANPAAVDAAARENITVPVV